MDYIIIGILACLTLPTCIRELHHYDLAQTASAKIKYIVITAVATFTYSLLQIGTPASQGLLALMPIFITLIMTDLKDCELPHMAVAWIGVIGFISLLQQYSLSGTQAFLPLITSGVLFSMYLVLALVVKSGLGGGDVKLIGALGLFFEPSMIGSLLILPFIIGSAFGVYWIFKHRDNPERKKTFPFGPAIIVAALILCI